MRSVAEIEAEIANVKREISLQRVLNEGGKINLNGTFGKTGSPFSILFAPEMMIQTTLTGQLSLLMLIEWHEHYGIRVVSANTDGMVIYCPRNMLHISDQLITEWEQRTSLQMEKTEYKAIYSRDVNNYFALKTKGGVKRKGAYAKADLIAKKSPHVEICGDAVAEYLEKGTPVSLSIAQCKDIRKFVTVRQVNGGGVKMWGESSRKEMKAAAMPPDLIRDGWTKTGTRWSHVTKGTGMLTRDAHKLSFPVQTLEYVGKAIRWYYSTQAPGSIVYKTNGNAVSLSYGAMPCMILPKELPADIDFGWYIATATEILHEIGALG